MDFELDDAQRAIVEAVDVLLERHAGPARAIELGAKGEYDGALHGALRESGFLELACGEGTGPLEAALLVECAARAGALCSVAASALVAPLVLGRPGDGPLALVESGSTAPIRYAAHAHAALVLDGDRARLVPLPDGSATPVASTFGYPMGRFEVGALSEGDDLGAGSGDRLRDAWRLALAVELAGSMAGALETTLTYVKERRQFGRAIGSFQGVQHRLARCHIQVQGSRWLALEAAHGGGATEASAAGAAYAAEAAGRVFAETHQFSGAMGFTREHDLHVWSMRLQALRLELDGVAGHERALAEARWA